MTETFPVGIYSVKASDAHNGPELQPIRDMYVAYCGEFKTAFRSTIEDAVESIVEQLNNDARQVHAASLLSTTREEENDQIVYIAKEKLKDSIWNVFGAKN